MRVSRFPVNRLALSVPLSPDHRSPDIITSSHHHIIIIASSSHLIPSRDPILLGDTCRIRAPVEVDPILTIKISPFMSFFILPAFFFSSSVVAASVLTPNKRRNKKKEISSSVNISGNLPTSPNTYHINQETASHHHRHHHARQHHTQSEKQDDKGRCDAMAIRLVDRSVGSGWLVICVCVCYDNQKRNILSITEQQERY